MAVALDMSSSGLTSSATASLDSFVETLQRLTSLREERQALVDRADKYDQVITLSAVNQSAAITVNIALITAMVKEAAKTRKEIKEIVSLQDLGI